MRPEHYFRFFINYMYAMRKNIYDTDYGNKDYICIAKDKK